MVINAGIRLDAVQYNTKIWADPQGNFSPYNPHYFFDCGTDLTNSNVDSDNNGIIDGSVGETFPKVFKIIKTSSKNIAPWAHGLHAWAHLWIYTKISKQLPLKWSLQWSHKTNL